MYAIDEPMLAIERKTMSRMKKSRRAELLQHQFVTMKAAPKKEATDATNATSMTARSGVSGGMEGARETWKKAGRWGERQRRPALDPTEAG